MDARPVIHRQHSEELVHAAGPENDGLISIYPDQNLPLKPIVMWLDMALGRITMFISEHMEQNVYLSHLKAKQCRDTNTHLMGVREGTLKAKWEENIKKKSSLIEGNVANANLKNDA